MQAAAERVEEEAAHNDAQAALLGQQAGQLRAAQQAWDARLADEQAAATQVRHVHIDSTPCHGLSLFHGSQTSNLPVVISCQTCRPSHGLQARARAGAQLQGMQAAAEDARAGLQAVQQERVVLQSQAACLRSELERLRDSKEMAEQVWPHFGCTSVEALICCGIAAKACPKPGRM